MTSPADDHGTEIKRMEHFAEVTCPRMLGLMLATFVTCYAITLWFEHRGRKTAWTPPPQNGAPHAHDTR